METLRNPILENGEIHKGAQGWVSLSCRQIGGIILEKSRTGEEAIILWKDYTADCFGRGILPHPSLVNRYGTMNRRPR